MARESVGAPEMVREGGEPIEAFRAFGAFTNELIRGRVGHRTYMERTIGIVFVPWMDGWESENRETAIVCERERTSNNMAMVFERMLRLFRLVLKLLRADRADISNVDMMVLVVPDPGQIIIDGELFLAELTPW